MSNKSSRWPGFLWLAAVALAALVAGLAGQQPAPVARIEAPKLVVLGAQNVTAEAQFTVVIAPGFHIQSNHPKLDYLIPSAIEVDPAPGISVGAAQWPAPSVHKFSFAPDALTVFEGTVRVSVPLRAAGAAPGEHELKGTFHYQACNDQMCRPPASAPFTLTVTIPRVR